MNAYVENEYAICPYCDYEDHDYGDYCGDNDGEVYEKNCDHCGEVYMLRTNIDVTFDTWEVKK